MNCITNETSRCGSIHSVMKMHKMLFVLSLFGLILAVYLTIQKARAFDHGCWGIGSEKAVDAAGGCNDPRLDRYSKLGNVPVAWLACALFAFSATLRFLHINEVRESRRQIWAMASTIVFSIATPYALFLVYVQVFVVHAHCPLCLSLSALIFGLFIGDLIALFGKKEESVTFVPDSTFSSRALLCANVLMVLTVLYSITGITAVDRPEPPVQQITSSDWVDAETPYLGSKNGTPVLAFLDPNCPHCGKTYDQIISLSKKYHDSATFYIVPRVLWPHSLLQSEALEVAKAHGKYFEMWELQFKNQQPGGLDSEEIIKLAASLKIDTSNIDQRLRDAKSRVIAVRDKAQANKINTTPVIFIRGRKISLRSSSTAEIETELKAALASERKELEKLKQP